MLTFKKSKSPYLRERGLLSFFQVCRSGFHDFLREKPSPLFMLLGWSSISITSLMMHSIHLDFIVRILVSWNWVWCECGKAYTGQTGSSNETRIKKHHWSIRLYHLDKSAMAECSINLGHCIQFQDTSILAMKSGCSEHIIREVRVIKLQPNK